MQQANCEKGGEKMEQKLKLMFVTEGDKTVTFTINKPAENLTDENVKTAMDTILAQDVIQTTSGALVSKKRAVFVTTEEREIALT